MAPQGGTDPREVAESRAVVVHDDDAVVWGMAVRFGAPLVPEAAGEPTRTHSRCSAGSIPSLADACKVCFALPAAGL